MNFEALKEYVFESHQLCYCVLLLCWDWCRSTGAHHPVCEPCSEHTCDPDHGPTCELFELCVLQANCSMRLHDALRRTCDGILSDNIMINLTHVFLLGSNSRSIFNASSNG